MRTGLLAFAAFFLVIAAWAVAAPYDGAPDELEHVVRAVGVVSGEVAPEPTAARRGSGAFQTVPRGLVRENCWAFRPETSAACAVPPDADTTPVVQPTGAGRYHPAYYALVGGPLVWLPGMPGVIVARLLGGAIAAAFLAGAVVAITRCSRNRVMAAGLLVAVTPMAVSMAGAINPNGIEIAAGAAFFAAVIPLLLGAPDRSTGKLLALAGTSGTVLATFRTTGLLCLAVAAVAMLVPWRGENVRRLAARRDTWFWTALVSIAAVTAVVWILVMKATDLGDFTGGRVLSTSQALLIEADNWRYLLDQMIGITSWLDVRMSNAAYTAWQLLAGALLVLGVIFGLRVDRWRSAVLVFGGFVVPAMLEVQLANETGFVSQGRYYLPMLAGVLLFAGFVLDERGLPLAQARATVRIVAAVIVPIHLMALVYAMVRWQQGLPAVGELAVTDLHPLAGDWHPATGSVLPLALSLTGLVLLTVLAWRLSAQPAASFTGAPGRSGPDGPASPAAALPHPPHG